MKINFFYAKQKHRMWKIRIRAFLMDIDDLENIEIKSHKSCELGIWIEKYAKKEFSGSSYLAGLVESHEGVHDAIKEVLVLRKKNQPKKAWEAFEKLEIASVEVINYLDKLKQSFNNTKEENQISAS